MTKLDKHPSQVGQRKVKAQPASYREPYWMVGQRIVEHEQSGAERAAYGQALLKRLAQDLTSQVGRGFSERNLELMRLFYLGSPNPQTASAKSEAGTVFPLPWSHYVRRLSVADPAARVYYEREALQGGWSVRQPDRQIAPLTYQRTRRPGGPGCHPRSDGPWTGDIRNTL